MFTIKEFYGPMFTVQDQVSIHDKYFKSISFAKQTPTGAEINVYAVINELTGHIYYQLSKPKNLI